MYEHSQQVFDMGEAAVYNVGVRWDTYIFNLGAKR